MNLKILFGLVFSSLIGAGTSAHAAVVWPKDQSPDQFMFMDEKLETNFNKLRMSATVDEKQGHAPWSSTYWPGDEGGIAVRYLARQGKKDQSAFTATHYSLAQLKTMSQEQIRILSPAEKLDIMNGDYDYPLTTRVLSDYDSKTKSWEGICHGWGPAAADYPEPQNTTFTNKDGIVVQVGSSDMKALMSFYYAWEASEQDDKNVDNYDFTTDAAGVTHYTQKDPNKVPFIYRGLGDRCAKGEDTCRGKGLNPAAFHLTLANIVGNYQRSYVVNVVSNDQIWNQPVYGYTTKILETKDYKTHSNETVPYSVDGSLSDTPAVTRILVNTQLYYVDEPDQVVYDPTGVPTKDAKTLSTKNLAYYLDLDAAGNIVGGDWSFSVFKPKAGHSDRIGFAWRASRVPFVEKFKVLNQLYIPVEKKTTSYAASRNYTPGLEDTYFEVNASTIPVYDWNSSP